MTKISLSKKWFLSGGILLLAFGCVKKPEVQTTSPSSSSMPQEQEDDLEEPESDESSTDEETSSRLFQKEKGAATAKKSESAPAQTPRVAEKEVTPSVQAPIAIEPVKPSQQPVVQTPNSTALPEEARVQGVAPEVRSELKATESKAAEPSQLQAAIFPQASL